MTKSIDEQKLVVEIISNLVNIKTTMADLILKPAGVPGSLYGPLLKKKDETGAPLSKRAIAGELLEVISAQDNTQQIHRAIIKIAANWDSYHLARDEFSARATVQKSREVLGAIQTMEAREARLRELVRAEELKKLEKDRAEMLSSQSSLLLMMFDEMAISDDPQRRGYLLQDLINRLFDLHQIEVVGSF